MHSSKPIEPHFVNDSSDPALRDESWRAEVASRVNRYRARRNHNGDEGAAPALDFGPAVETPSVDTLNRSPQSYAPRSRGNQGAFGTDYYRRLNAESRAQLPVRTTGAATAATASVQEFEDEFQEAADAALLDEMSDALPDQSSEEFDADPALDLEIRPSVTEDSVLDRYHISEPEPAAPVAPPVTQPVAPPTPPEQGNLIVFRRPAMEPPLLPKPSRDELAEPMNNRPRILEVPEDIMPAVQGSLFPEIRLDADEQEPSSAREPRIEIPLSVAEIPERLMASLMDFGVVLAAGLLFGAIAWRVLPEIPHSKPFWMVLGAVTFLFWAVYQHLFLLYAGRTLGMSIKGIRLSTFDGQMPGWEQRRRRAHFMCVSFAPVTLGFLWALVDEDTLCWHDRISQTFPTGE